VCDSFCSSRIFDFATRLLLERRPSALLLFIEACVATGIVADAVADNAIAASLASRNNLLLRLCCIIPLFVIVFMSSTKSLLIEWCEMVNIASSTWFALVLIGQHSSAADAVQPKSTDSYVE
jgi:hypothetical protein